MTTPTRINILGGDRVLVRVSYDEAELAVESNLGDAATDQALGDAMIRLGRTIGAEDQARAEVAGARGQAAIAHVLARMVSELNADLEAPEFDVDLGAAWAAST